MDQNQIIYMYVQGIFSTKYFSTSDFSTKYFSTSDFSTKASSTKEMSLYKHKIFPHIFLEFKGKVVSTRIEMYIRKFPLSVNFSSNNADSNSIPLHV